VELLLRTDRILGTGRRQETAVRAMNREAGNLRRFPAAFGRLLAVLACYQRSPVDIALLGDPADPALRKLLQSAHGPFLPNRMVLGGDPSKLPDLPLLRGKSVLYEKATAFVCQDFTCGPPIHEAAELRKDLAHAAGSQADPGHRSESPQGDR
jgi:hypothetical protein